MQALLLKSQGLLRKRVAAILNVNVTTVDTYFDLFREGRVAALTHVGYEGSPNLLEQRKDEIIPSLEANPPATLKEAQAKIKEVTGLKRSLPRVSAFLKKTNLRAAK
jgi:transposase